MRNSNASLVLKIIGSIMAAFVIFAIIAFCLLSYRVESSGNATESTQIKESIDNSTQLEESIEAEE